MNRIIDLVAAIAFVISMAACQTNPYPDKTASPDNGKMNNVIDNGNGAARSSGAIGGETGSSAVRQAP
jgi:hypothetical protein